MLTQGTQLKLGQGLAMTPQLQQAIKLLQLSSIELEQEIQQALDSNPLLEREESEDILVTSETDVGDMDETTISANSESSLTETIPEKIDADTQWEDTYDLDWQETKTASDASVSDTIEKLHSAEEGLQEHLNWQIQMSSLSVVDQQIARIIIDYIDADGYFIEPLENIVHFFENQYVIDVDDVQAVLRYIQHLDPLGVAAIGLGDSLWIQFNHYYPKHKRRRAIKTLLKKHLDLLGKHDYKSIKRCSGLTKSQTLELIAALADLEPDPVGRFRSNDTILVKPDVYVSMRNGTWQVALGSDSGHGLCLNQQYTQWLEEPIADKQTSDYIKNNLQQAKWFIKSLDNRNSTILRVARAIVEKQMAFLIYGDQAMKPMRLKDLAEELELHESTVSRVTTQKYMQTPQGIYELKHFFSSSVDTDAGGACSSTAVRALIKKIVNDENPRKPYSDNKLTSLLNEQGINVARRTVAKYRESLLIPSSHDRKILS